MHTINIKSYISNQDNVFGLKCIFNIMFESQQDDKIIWDFKNIQELSFNLLAVLSIFKESLGNKVTEKNISDSLQSQMNCIGYFKHFKFTNNNSLKELEKYKDQNLTFTPICRFNLAYSEIDEMQSEIYSVITNSVLSKSKNWNPRTLVSYILGELCCNIQEHSQASRGYIFMFINPLTDSLNIYISDNGITIHGSYLQNGNQGIRRLIGNDTTESLLYATKGISTKNRPETENRGYGISTNLEMIVNGLNGDFSILSGTAFFNSNQKGEQFIQLPNGISWDGTLVLINIPLQQNEEFNVYNYIG